MKKAAVLGLASLFLVTGCGSKVTCSRTLKEDGQEMKVKVTGKVKSGKIDSVEVVYETPSKEMAQLFCTFYKDAKCSGKKATISGDAALEMMDITKEDLGSKSEFVKSAKANGFKCN